MFGAVMNKKMEWFDRNVSGGEECCWVNGQVLKAGSFPTFPNVFLDIKKSRETDDVRSASSLAAGLLLQHLTTTLVSLILAFHRSFSLTLIILASLPLLTFLQSLSQSLAHPLLTQEQHHTISTINRAASAILTVKVFIQYTGY